MSLKALYESEQSEELDYLADIPYHVTRRLSSPRARYSHRIGDLPICSDNYLFSPTQTQSHPFLSPSS